MLDIEDACHEPMTGLLSYCSREEECKQAEHGRSHGLRFESVGGKFRRKFNCDASRCGARPPPPAHVGAARPVHGRRARPGYAARRSHSPFFPFDFDQ